MTTKGLTYQQSGSFINTRLLGTLGMLGSSMLFIEGISVGFKQHGTDQVIAVLEVIYILAWMASLYGMHLTDATGKGKGGKTLLVIQFLGLLTAALWSAYHLVALNPDTNHPLYIATDISWPFSHVFMIVMGIATLRAKSWTGWAKFTPLLCGLALPMAILSGIALGEVALGIVFGLGTTTAFMLLGYAVRNNGQPADEA
jgi:hypothetical protein